MTTKKADDTATEGAGQEAAAPQGYIHNFDAIINQAVAELTAKMKEAAAPILTQVEDIKVLVKNAQDAAERAEKALAQIQGEVGAYLDATDGGASVPAMTGDDLPGLLAELQGISDSLNAEGQTLRSVIMTSGGHWFGIGKEDTRRPSAIIPAMVQDAGINRV